MSTPHPKLKWSDAEKQAVERAFLTTTNAKDFFASFRAAVPDAPPRSTKAYLTHLCRAYADKSSRHTPVYLDLNRLNAEEIAAEGTPKTAPKPSSQTAPLGHGKEWLDEIDPAPAPPTTPPRPAPAPNFVKPAVKPDPNARVPRHIPVPPESKTSFTPQETATALGVPFPVVTRAVNHNQLPHRQTVMNGPVIDRREFDVLHAVLSEGYGFDHACLLATASGAFFAPIVPAESLYAPEPVVDGLFDEVKSEPEPSNEKPLYPRGPELSLRDSLNDPNPDAKETFTIEEAANVLGMDKPDRLFATISDGVFPAVADHGKWYILRSDLKRVEALRAVGLSVGEALLRAGNSIAEGAPDVPVETSWTDHLAPLIPVEVGEVAHPTPVKTFARPAPATETGDERRWALEALGEGVFTVEQALKIAGVTDNPRNVWTLGLLGRGEITLAQAAKLLK